MARVVGPDLSSRNFQLNNPLSISWDPTVPWQGLAANPHDEPPKGMTKLCRFESAVWGIRAGARQLIANQDKHDCGTIAEQITRWAPPPKKAPKDKNATAAYIKFVSAAMDIGPDDPIDVHRYGVIRPMIEAMIDFEGKGSGHPYTDAQIDKALLLAGVEKAKPGNAVPLSAKVAAGGLGLTSVSTMAQQAQDIAEPITGLASTLRMVLVSLKPLAPYMVWFAIIMAATGLGVIAYRYIQNRRLGL